MLFRSVVDLLVFRGEAAAGFAGRADSRDGAFVDFDGCVAGAGGETELVGGRGDFDDVVFVCGLVVCGAQGGNFFYEGSRGLADGGGDFDRRGERFV